MCRNKVITTHSKHSDNYGFARWVEANKEELLKLGDGYHYGEWWGKGIQQNTYDVEDRYFSIFRVDTPEDRLPSCARRVPVLYHGPLHEVCVKAIMLDLSCLGSVAAYEVHGRRGLPSEGIVIYHHNMQRLSKITFSHDKGKWSKEIFYKQ